MKQAAIFILAAVAASAAPISVKITNAGNPIISVNNLTIDGKSYSNVDIGPYTMLINGVSTPALCIDFVDNTSLNTSYNANVTPVGSTTLSNTYLVKDGVSSQNAGIEYEEEAYLFSQIVKPGANRTGLQEAAWDITSYGITNSSYTTTFNIADNSYIDAALADYSKMNVSGYEIISDTTIHGEQEFLIDPSPEPASALLLGVGLLAGASVIAYKRRRAVSELSAEQK